MVSELYIRILFFREDFREIQNLKEPSLLNKHLAHFTVSLSTCKLETALLISPYTLSVADICYHTSVNISWLWRSDEL